MLRDKDTFERMLADGLSLDAMAARLGLTPSTVSWWLTRHGLAPIGRARYGPKPPLDEAALAQLVADGLGVVALARELKTTTDRVRRALRRVGLTTVAARRRAQADGIRASGAERALLHCSTHGPRDHVVTRTGSLVCTKCRSDAVVRRRQEVKRVLVMEAGGRCATCGYAASQAALQFHHLDPAHKEHTISLSGRTRSLAALRAEAAKCVLLCANCHAEVEHGDRPPPDLQ